MMSFVFRKIIYKSGIDRQSREAIYLPSKTILQKRGRDRLNVIWQILEASLEGALKTTIMYRVNLSFANLNQYLNYLLERGLIEASEGNGKRIFKTTENGILFIQSYREIKHLSSSADETVHNIAKMSEKGKKSLPMTKETPLANDELLTLVIDYGRKLEKINEGLSSLENKLNTIYAEMKKIAERR
jgi:predicted transcriptional regulator